LDVPSQDRAPLFNFKDRATRRYSQVTMRSVQRIFSTIRV
jgi:hypothetical protein